MMSAYPAAWADSSLPTYRGQLPVILSTLRFPTLATPAPLLRSFTVRVSISVFVGIIPPDPSPSPRHFLKITGRLHGWKALIEAIC